MLQHRKTNSGAFLIIPMKSWFIKNSVEKTSCKDDIPVLRHEYLSLYVNSFIKFMSWVISPFINLTWMFYPKMMESISLLQVIGNASFPFCSMYTLKTRVKLLTSYLRLERKKWFCITIVDFVRWNKFIFPIGSNPTFICYCSTAL